MLSLLSAKVGADVFLCLQGCVSSATGIRHRLLICPLSVVSGALAALLLPCWLEMLRTLLYVQNVKRNLPVVVPLACVKWCTSRLGIVWELHLGHGPAHQDTRDSGSSESPECRESGRDVGNLFMSLDSWFCNISSAKVTHWNSVLLLRIFSCLLQVSLLWNCK